MHSGYGKLAHRNAQPCGYFLAHLQRFAQNSRFFTDYFEHQQTIANWICSGRKSRRKLAQFIEKILSIVGDAGLGTLLQTIDRLQKRSDMQRIRGMTPAFLYLHSHTSDDRMTPQVVPLVPVNELQPRYEIPAGGKAPHLVLSMSTAIKRMNITRDNKA